ncbi:hypothetical protein GGR67_002162 [Xanthomonas arboricola]|nr:hypothetical protein [Xanthomonas euroxanthea]
MSSADLDGARVAAGASASGVFVALPSSDARLQPASAISRLRASVEVLMADMAEMGRKERRG